MIYMWKVYYSRAAQKDLRKLSPEVRKRIIEKIRFFVRSKNPFGFADKLSGAAPSTWRFRIGKWRARFIIENNTILITRVRRRDEAY